MSLSYTLKKVLRSVAPLVRRIVTKEPNKKISDNHSFLAPYWLEFFQFKLCFFKLGDYSLMSFCTINNRILG